VLGPRGRGASGLLGRIRLLDGRCVAFSAASGDTAASSAENAAENTPHITRRGSAMTQERKKAEAKLEDTLKPEELKKKKKLGEQDDAELDGISGGEGMDTGKIIP